MKWDELQLKFDLDLDEAEDDARERAITPEEARLISEAAAKGFRDRIERYKGEKSEPPEWIKDFTMLREQGWPWRVACYIAWSSSPKTDRWPATLQELATEILGLKSPRVIYTWRQKYASINTTVAMMQAKPLWEHRRDVIEALVRMAKDPDYKAFNDRKLFLEMTGDYTPKSKLEVGKSAKGDALDELSDEELREWMGADQADRGDQEDHNDQEDRGEDVPSATGQVPSDEGNDAGE